MDGKEAVREVRKMGVKIPVFVASGYADDPIMAHPATEILITADSGAAMDIDCDYETIVSPSKHISVYPIHFNCNSVFFVEQE